MAKERKRKIKRIAWTKADDAELKKYSKAKLPVAKISKAMKRTVAAVRQRGYKLGISLGHRR